jgi:GxxExxY protein
MKVGQPLATESTHSTEGTGSSKLLYEAETFAIRGAAFEVYREMGCGFLEAVYQECMEKELTKRGVPFVSRQELTLFYKCEPLVQTYQSDLVCFGTIIVELKATKDIAPEHQAQLQNYLKASGLRLGLIINFGTYGQAQIQRIIR